MEVGERVSELSGVGVRNWGGSVDSGMVLTVGNNECQSSSVTKMKRGGGELSWWAVLKEALFEDQL